MTPSLHTFAALEEARRNTPLSHLSPTEMTMIAGFALQWRDKEPLTVLTAMRLFDDQLSPSTVHRHIKKLRVNALISVTPDKDDNRIKHIVPTLRLLGAFKKIEDALAQCEVMA